MQKTSRPNSPSHRRTLAVTLLTAVLAAASSAHAASQTWTNSASDLLWNTTSLDWTGAAWTNNNDAVFGATGVGSIAVASDVVVNDIAFNTAGYTLTGNLMLANDKASTFTGSANATISAIIADNTAGASSLTRTTTGTLTLSGANTYSGGTSISGGGTLSAGNDAAFGTGTVAFSGNNSTTVASSTNVTLANNFTGTGNFATFNASGGTMTINGNFTGNRQWNVIATNKITFNGTNSLVSGFNGQGLNITAGAGGVEFGGTTTISGASSATNGGYVLIAGSAVSVKGTMTLNGTTNASKALLTVGNSAAAASLSVDGGTLNVGGEMTAQVGGVAGSTGVLTINTGTATITRTIATATDARSFIAIGQNTSTGTINLNGGTLATGRNFVRDGNSTADATGTANFVFGGGTLKALANQTDWLNTATINTNQLALTSVTTTAVSTIDSNGFSVAINSAISGAGGFNIISSSGAGTVTFGGVNTYLGATTVTSGTLTLGANAGTATFLADTSDLYLTTGSLLNLSFTSNSVLESISGLYIDGAQQLAGTWGAIGSGATFESALITGTGLLNVTASAIPEPSTYAAIAGVLALGAVIIRRRRASAGV